MQVVYDTGQHARRASAAATPTGPGERRVPVLVIRAGREGAADTAAAAGGAGASDERGLDVAGTDYRLTLSPEALSRDREVRAHERAHIQALGGYASSGIVYDTRTGPGGEQVAVGGRIAVDLAEVPGDPRATLRKARTIYAAATAPGDPSGADMRVAARAYALMRDARSELADERAGRDVTA